MLRLSASIFLLMASILLFDSFNTTKAQIGCSVISGLVVGGGGSVGVRYGSTCTAWGTASCSGLFSCAPGSTKQETGTGINVSGYTNTYFICVSN